MFIVLSSWHTVTRTNVIVSAGHADICMTCSIPMVSVCTTGMQIAKLTQLLEYANAVWTPEVYVSK